MIPNPVKPPVPDEKPAESLARIENARKEVTSLLKGWDECVSKQIDENRLMRKVRVDVEGLIAKGRLGPSDTYIGVRVIDNNIYKDIPPYIAYLKQSRRLAIFEPVDMNAPKNDTERVESETTRVLTYPEWEYDYIRWLDGAELHGWNWAEVVYDVEKPGHCAVNHVGTDDLVFDLGVRSIQDSRVVLRRYKPTLNRLKELAKEWNFDPKVVEELENKLREKSGQQDEADAGNNTTEIFKMMYKEDGVVWCGWITRACESGKWLRECKLFYNGVDDEKVEMPPAGVDPATGLPTIPTPIVSYTPHPEQDYPYYLLIYRLTEDETIVESQGRAEMDLYIQETSCTLWTALANSAYRSSKTMWMPESLTDSPGGVAPKQLDIVWKEGALWDRPMKAVNSNPPDPMLPKALDMLQTQNADNMNQPAWTVNNRQDSRKTATEVSAATAQGAMINSVNVVLFSAAMRNILCAAWRIIQSQAAQEKIAFLVGPDGANQLEIIKREYNVKAAGDVDYIERQEQVQKMQMDWPVFQATPIAQVFLEEYIRVRYPSIADRLIEQLRMGDPKAAVIQQLGAIVSQAVTDENGQLRPEWAPHADALKQVQASAQAALQPPPQAAPPQPPQQ